MALWLDFCSVGLMNYHLRRQGEDLGVFPLEELRRRRQAGELTGLEYVQGEGMEDWQPLDLVLQRGYRTVPPPVPGAGVRRGPNATLVWTGIAGAVVLVVLFFAGIGVMVSRIQRNLLPI